MANLIIWQCVNDTSAPIRTIAGYQLASWLRQHGYTVKVIDFCHLIPTSVLAEITAKYIGGDTLAVGVSSTFWHGRGDDVRPTKMRGFEPDWVIKARELVEKQHPKLYWLLGGARTEYKTSHKHWVRFSGYAEDSLLKWMDQNTNRYVRRDLYDVQTFMRSFAQDDFIRPTEVLPIDLGRGCMFKCRFCNYPLVGKKPGTYLRDIKQVREEILFNYHEYGTTKYYYLDETVNETLEKVEALAELAQSLPFAIQWVGYCRADLIDKRPDMVRLLEESGMASCHFGIESFNRTAALSIGKGWSATHGKDFLLSLKDKWGDRISWSISMIAGLPGETESDLNSTLDWCIQNQISEVKFNDLGIDSTPSKLWKSEFELNYSKYGFRFPDPNQPMYWESDDWTSTLAHQAVVKLRKRGWPHWRLAGWALPAFSFTGQDLHSLSKEHVATLDWHEYTHKAYLFVRDYAKAHLK
jgi:Radical SAM superfamily